MRRVPNGHAAIKHMTHAMLQVALFQRDIQRLAATDLDSLCETGPTVADVDHGHLTIRSLEIKGHARTMARRGLLGTSQVAQISAK